MQIARALAGELLGSWDGIRCIEYMRATGCKNWAQTEWIGFYFEHRAKQILAKTIGGEPGPKIGHVAIDYAVKGQPWDFKAHSIKKYGGWAYLNDVEAVDTCALHLGGIGWIIAVGTAEHDEDGSFRDWHERLKGAPSRYSRERQARGAPSRPRKRSFNCSHFLIAKVFSPEQISAAMDAKLLRSDMQIGQRNSDGSARRPKYGIHMKRAEASVGGPHMLVIRYPPATR